MKHYLLALLFAGINVSALADQPPSWSGFSIQSANARFTASVAPLGAGKTSPPRERQFRIQVQKTDGNGLPVTIWEGPYHHDGYAGGLLSDDGEYFVYIDYWYRNTTAAVQIYHRGASCYFTGKQLKMNEAGLRETVSHRLWLDGNAQFDAPGVSAVAVLVPTVQGVKRIELGPIPSFNGTACTGHSDHGTASGKRQKSGKPPLP
jgi:hypothetical protein